MRVLPATVVLSSLPLILASCAPAQARPKARMLYSCEAYVQPVEGGSFTVLGWGYDEDSARGAAQRLGWTVAEAHQQDALMAARLDGKARVLRERFVPGSQLRVPGYRIKLHDRCKELELARHEGGWRSSFGDDEAVLRHDPLVALEGARRRSCWGDWQDKIAAELQARGKGLGVEELSQCLARRDFRLEPTQKELAQPVVSGGLYECRSLLPLAMGEEVPVQGLAVGFGATLEQAQEDSLQQSLPMLLRKSLAVSIEADELRSAAGLGYGSFLVGTSERLERAQLSCQVATPEGELRLHYPQGSNSCGEGERSVSTPAQARAGRTALCVGERQVPEPLGVIPWEAWGRALRCDLSCEAGLRLDGTTWTPTRLPDEPARASQAEAEATLRAAVKAQDIETVLTVAPIVRKSMGGGGDAGFWGKLAGSLDNMLYWGRWVEVDGAWMLVHPARLER